MTDNLGFILPKHYWLRTDTKPISQGSKPDRYLRSRGIALTRFPRDLREDKDGNMVAIIRDRDGKGVSWHRTCLDDDAKCYFKYVAKGEIPKGSAIRLGPAGQAMGASEGIENALSASILSGRNGKERIPVWAAVNGSMLANFDPPFPTERYYIFADNDKNGIGLKRANQSKDNSWAKEIRIMMPPKIGTDYNDMLRSLQKDEMSVKRMRLVQATNGIANKNVVLSL